MYITILGKWKRIQKLNGFMVNNPVSVFTNTTRKLVTVDEIGSFRCKNDMWEFLNTCRHQL